MYRVISCVVETECLLWPVHSLGKTLLAFVLLHFVLQGQTCLLFYISLDFLLMHSSLLRWNYSKLEKEYIKAVYCHSCLFNLYAEYITLNARLDESQAGIKIARINISNLRYADDNTLMAGSEELLKSLFTKVKEQGDKVGLNLNIQKMKIMASSPITSW